MSILTKKMRTNKPLWIAFSGLLFVLLGSIDPVPRLGGLNSYWGFWDASLRGFSNGSIGVLVVGGIVLAALSLIIGWALQAIVVVTLTCIRSLVVKKAS